MGVRLTWEENNPDEDGHRVYRSESPMDPESLPSPLATLGADVTSYDDTTAVDETLYYYRVSSYKGSEEQVSDEISFTPIPNTVYVIYGDGTDIYLWDSVSETDSLLPITLTRLDDLDFDYSEDRVFVSGNHQTGNPEAQIYNLSGTLVYQEPGTTGHWTYKVLANRPNSRVLYNDVINTVDDIRAYDYDGSFQGVLGDYSSGNYGYFTYDPVTDYLIAQKESNFELRYIDLSTGTLPHSFDSDGTLITATGVARRFGVRPSEGKLYYCPSGETTLWSVTYAGVTEDLLIDCDTATHVYVDEYENVYYKESTVTMVLPAGTLTPEVFAVDVPSMTTFSVQKVAAS